MRVIVTVYGCDDSTSVELDIDLGEFETLQRVAREITEASTYQCMPTMKVTRKDLATAQQRAEATP